MKAAARRLVLVSDLRRSATGYFFAWAGCRLLSRSRVFHVDGTRSVAAAFTPAEARASGREGGAGRRAFLDALAAALAAHLEPGVSIFDAIVIGAGPAGSLAACLMARSGARSCWSSARRFRDRRSAAAASMRTRWPRSSAPGSPTGCGRSARARSRRCGSASGRARQPSRFRLASPFHARRSTPDWPPPPSRPVRSSHPRPRRAS